MNATRVSLVHSGTAALEMAALILGIEPGDEVIVPSYTFVTTASAFALRGAHLRFVDICPDTLNLCPKQLEAAISPRTRVIVPVHYAGLACEMDPIMAIARANNLYVVEDAAQAYGATYKHKKLGSFGDIGCFSFHGTKNISCGEGGAITINNPELKMRAEIVREKGTNRSAFFRGEVDKYTWRELGSSFLPSEITAAFLLPQLQKCDEITDKRRTLWERYHNQLSSSKNFVTPQRNEDSVHNAHIFYILTQNLKHREQLREKLLEKNIQATSHYLPLHLSPMGKKKWNVHR